MNFEWDVYLSDYIQRYIWT